MIIHIDWFIDEYVIISLKFSELNIIRGGIIEHIIINGTNNFKGKFMRDNM